MTPEEIYRSLDRYIKEYAKGSTDQAVFLMEVLDRHRTVIVTALVRHAKPPQLPMDDLMQMFFLQVLEKYPVLSTKPRFGGTYAAMIRNLKLNFLRENRISERTVSIIQNFYSEYSAEYFHYGESGEIPASELNRIKKALSTLSMVDQNFLRLYLFEGRLPKEIAQEVGRSKRGVELAIYRAKKKLMEKLKE